MYYNHNPYHNGERFFFFPFLGPLILGGLGGAAIASAARPRPIYAYPPMPYAPRPYPYNYYGGYNYY